MGGRGIWIFLALMVAGVGPIVSFVWINKLGDLATSPQTVEMNLGTTSFVAGGRARIWFASVDLGPQIEVTCKEESRLLELSGDSESDEVCGIRVSLVDWSEKERKGMRRIRATFRVAWDGQEARNP